MARTAKPDPTALGPQFPTKSPPDILAGTELLARSAGDVERIEQQLSTMGISVEYSVEACMSIAASQLAVMRNSAMVLGGVLALIRCKESNERFSAALEQLQLSRSSAYRCIAVFVRLASMPQMIDLGNSKCFELLTVDDETLRQIDAGEYASLTADSLGEMSVRELRAELKKLREQNATKDKLLKAKQDRIGELTDKLDIVESDRLERFAQATSSITENVNSALKALTKCEEQLLAFERLEAELEGAPQGVRDQVYGLREMLRERLTAVAN